MELSQVQRDLLDQLMEKHEGNYALVVAEMHQIKAYGRTVAERTAARALLEAAQAHFEAVTEKDEERYRNLRAALERRESERRASDPYRHLRAVRDEEPLLENDIHVLAGTYQKRA